MTKALNRHSEFSAGPDTLFRVQALEGDPYLTERLREVGVHPGVELSIVRKLPFGGAQVIRLGEVDVALRDEEAACIRIAKA